MKSHYALILAGGQGTRFWPWSTEEKPKQFLAIIGDQPLLTQTYSRLRQFIPEKNIFIIAAANYFPAIRACLPRFSKSNFIAEPAPRNTAPALILANMVIGRRDPEARLLVIPADHCIREEKKFTQQLQAGLLYARHRCIVTTGIKPDYPHTGYGYIQFDKKRVERLAGSCFYSVVRFKEKPDVHTAQAYIRQGNYYWNSGMFIYKLSHFKEFLQIYAPYYFRQYLLLEAHRDQNDTYQRIFKSMRPDSIDYVLLEKMKEVRMFAARFHWNDVGSWMGVFQMNKKNRDGNVCSGVPIVIDTRDSLVFSLEEKPLAVIGLDKMAVIQSPGGVLVCRLQDSAKSQNGC